MHEGGHERRAEFQTVTHARLRASQGDVRGAREVLHAVLRRRPGDAAARDLLASLEAEAHRPGRRDAEEALADPAAARAEDLRDRFVRELGSAGHGGRRRRALGRLRAWLERAERAAGGNDA
jgi:hypothetical protein